MNYTGIGELLVKNGTLTPQQLQSYSIASKEHNQTLHDYLIANNILSQEVLAQTYATYFAIQYIEKINDTMARPELLAKIPLKFLREHSVIPVILDNKITLITSNPFDFQPLDELKLLLGEQAPLAIATKHLISEAIDRYYPIEGTKQMIQELEEEHGLHPNVDLDVINEQDILGMANEAPIIKLVNHILYQAVKRGSSDIHVEPFEKEIRVR
jgi:type II secretory ATPase GspE/PulE/Tfp pilus assembly ATPase PilB-like protein